MKLVTLSAIAALSVAGAYAQASDAVVTLEGRKKAVSAVAYTAPLGVAADPAAFNESAQECVVRNVSFDDFVARDTSRSFVGGYSGRLYQFGDTSTYAGDNHVIAFVSSSKPLVVARGRQDIRGIGGQVVQFSVALGVENGALAILFEDVERGFSNSGSARNTGFNPVYQAWGAGYKNVYAGFDSLAADLASCMG